MERTVQQRLVSQLKHNIGEIRFAFFAGTIVAIIMTVAAALAFSDVKNNSLIWFFISPLLLFVVIATVGGLCEGRAFWWFLCALTFVGLLAFDGLIGLVVFSGINNNFVWLGVFASLLVSCFFSWRWGANVYNLETMKHVLDSKRIDVEKGTYSPFTFPFGILTTKRSKRWFTVANASGPLIISLTLIFGNWLGEYSPKGEQLWGTICFYGMVVLFLGAFRAGLGEYAWIRRWEKETSRKMYISYVVDWKRYKGEEKKHRQAEQSKLRSSRN